MAFNSTRKFIIGFTFVFLGTGIFVSQPAPTATIDVNHNLDQALQDLNQLDSF